MKILLYILLLLSAQQAFSQEMIRIDVSSEDPYGYYVNDKDSTRLFYYKIVPEKQPVGVLMILPSSGESIENMLDQITLDEEAVKNNLLVVLPSYNWGTIQQIPEIAFFDTIFKQVVDDHNVSKENFFFCGLSNGAMISLTYAVKSVRDKNTFLIPKGIIGLDPPLDLARFYKYCEREIERNFSDVGVSEAKWLKNVYDQVYGGSPDSVPMAYQQASVFTFGAEKGGNTQYLNNIGIRMYSDLNIDFLINQRRRNLYDWNGTDIVAFVNQLKLNGNKNANVFISQNKGKRSDGSPHPHSWSILDTDSTIEWILELLNQEKTDQPPTAERYSFDKKFSTSKYLEDLNQLVDSIQNYHPQLYEFVTENEFDQFIQAKENEINDSTTIAEFSWICNEIAAKVGCVHTNTNTGNMLNIPSEKFFPLKVEYIDSKLYIIEPYQANEEIKPGLEIVKINGLDVLDIKEKIAQHISADGYNRNLTEGFTNKYFSYFCAIQLNFPTAYSLEIREKGKNKEILLKKALPQSPQQESDFQTSNLEFSHEPSKNLAIVKIKSFVYYEDQFPVFKSFIDSCFQQIELHQIENLVIDLRNNGGGDPFCASYLLQYISDKAFRYYKPGTTDYYKDLEKEILPQSNNFTGKLFVLINSLCNSTTGHLSSLLKHRNIGTLIGSETGATFSCNARTINFKLKNTGINASVATKTYQTDVSGFRKDQGIMPDIQIDRNIDQLLSKQDLEMEKVMDLIKRN